MVEQVLSGIRVLDLSEQVAGPYCTKLLADFGAEVIKVEKPGRGDSARSMGPFLDDVPHPEKSGLFLYLNTNKKSITLDIGVESGAQILKRLVKDVDVLVEDTAPGKMADLGLGWPDLEKINSNLIYTSITPFGQTGPYRHWRSVDMVPYALGGWMYLTGESSREPLKTGGRIGEYVPGLFATVGTLASLLGRSRTGGQQVDISAVESIIPILSFPTLASSYLGGVLFKRIGNRLPTTHPFTILPASDGYVGVISLTNLQWEMLCQMMDIPHLLEDERLMTNPGRAENADFVDEAMKPWLAARTKEECFHAAQEWRLPFAIVPTTEDMLNLPQHEARKFFVEIDHPVAGKHKYPGAPFKANDAPWSLRSPAPLLGQHNLEIYGSLGYSREDLIRLTERGII